MPVRSSVPLRRKKSTAKTYLSRTRVTRPLGIKKGKRVKYVTPFTQPRGSTAQFVDLPPEMLAKIGDYIDVPTRAAFRSSAKTVSQSVKPKIKLSKWLHQEACNTSQGFIKTVIFDPRKKTLEIWQGRDKIKELFLNASIEQYIKAVRLAKNRPCLGGRSEIPAEFMIWMYRPYKGSLIVL